MFTCDFCDREYSNQHFGFETLNVIGYKNDIYKCEDCEGDEFYEHIIKIYESKDVIYEVKYFIEKDGKKIYYSSISEMKQREKV